MLDDLMDVLNTETLMEGAVEKVPSSLFDDDGVTGDDVEGLPELPKHEGLTNG